MGVSWFCTSWRGFTTCGAAALLAGGVAMLAAAGTEPCGPGGGGASGARISATLEDFFEPGTQESTLQEPFIDHMNCRFCHEIDDEFDGNEKLMIGPYNNWIMSMMGQSARDPVWHAALAIANQDADFSGDACIRCHAPNAWLSGRSVPTDTSAFIDSDWAGVTCNFCHRMVDPFPSPKNPPEDNPILAALASEGLLPTALGNGRYVVDPIDTRRGPLDDVPANYHGVPLIVSPYHSEATLCGACHDVSNAMFTRNADGTFALNACDTAHPTLHPHDMMPEQRTYSEWLNSTFASTGVAFADGRFGGDHPTGVMSSCQDCHMPKVSGGLCVYWDYEPFFPRPHNADHGFVGSNTWVIGAVQELYGEPETGLTTEHVQINRSRTEAMLRAASDMNVSQVGGEVKVRITNYTGHKLPTGYPEGRRMWINVQFLDAKGNLLSERGAYDFVTAALNTSDTKVYEMKLGMDEAVAGQANLPPGQSFHLVLNNQIIKDNRIPPMGFTNAAFNAISAPVVGYSYADGQHWDDTLYSIPRGAAEAVVTLYYQTTSRDYIEFLRDSNKVNDAGQIAYDLWVSQGKSAPVDMDVATLPLITIRPGDINGDGIVNVDDLLLLLSGWGRCPQPNRCAVDLNADGLVNVDDLLMLLSNWG